MGIRASLTVISRETFDECVQGGEPDLKGDSYFIDKAWHDFYDVFKSKGDPLCRVITGDFLHPGHAVTFEEFCEGEELYVGFMSPELVQRIAAVLTNLSHAQLQTWYEEENVGGYDIEFSLFESLKAAYMQASQSGDAVLISIC